VIGIVSGDRLMFNESY